MMALKRFLSSKLHKTNDVSKHYLMDHEHDCNFKEQLMQICSANWANVCDITFTTGKEDSSS